MSGVTSDLRRQPSRRLPNYPGRRFHGAQLPDGVIPATFQSHVLLGTSPRDLHEPFWSPFEEAMLLVPSVGTSYQLQPLLPYARPVPLMRQNAQSQTREGGSKLSKEEQRQSLQKLRKETYMPKYMYTHTAKMISRVGQYYKGRPVTNNNEYERSSDGDKCAICLEEFEPREEVTITPCSHMFHDDCIIPWVRSNGQCPVCRSMFYERVQGNSERFGDMQGTPIRNTDNILTAELMSIVRAIDGGFEWGHY